MKQWILICGLGLGTTFPGMAYAHGEMAAPDTTAPAIINAIVPAIQQCWTPPATPAGETPKVSLKVRFNEDGSLNGSPEIVTKAEGATGDAFTTSTVSAVEKCGPYKVLLSHPYERWREIVLNFNL